MMMRNTIWKSSLYWFCCLVLLVARVTTSKANDTVPNDAVPNDAVHYVTVKEIPYREVAVPEENTVTGVRTSIEECIIEESMAVKEANESHSACLLDVYYPKNRSGFTTIVWYHGGGLTSGHKHIPESLQEKGIAVVAVEYRLSPAVDFPVFIEDAAAAAVWVKRHIGEYGGDANRVFLAGGSAGGYLTAMIGMDPRWLTPYGMSSRDFAGIIPVSAQVTTHFHVKKLLGDQGDQYQPVIDQNAPLGHLSKNLPPILLIVGDRKWEWKARVEENELMYASLKAIGHLQVFFHENAGFDHGISGLGNDCEVPAQQILDFIASVPCLTHDE